MGVLAKLFKRKTASGKQTDTSNLDKYDYWLCGDWYPTKKRGVYYFYNHKYVDYSRGDLLSLPKTAQGWPIYKVIDIHGSGGDSAMFDDGRKYDLKFIRYSSKPKIPNKKIMAR